MSEGGGLGERGGQQRFLNVKTSRTFDGSTGKRDGFLNIVGSLQSIYVKGQVHWSLKGPAYDNANLAFIRNLLFLIPCPFSRSSLYQTSFLDVARLMSNDLILSVGVKSAGRKK